MIFSGTVMPYLIEKVVKNFLSLVISLEDLKKIFFFSLYERRQWSSRTNSLGFNSKNEFLWFFFSLFFLIGFRFCLSTQYSHTHMHIWMNFGSSLCRYLKWRCGVMELKMQPINPKRDYIKRNHKHELSMFNYSMCFMYSNQSLYQGRLCKGHAWNITRHH